MVHGKHYRQGGEYLEENWEEGSIKNKHDPIMESGNYIMRTNSEVYQMYLEPNVKSFLRGKSLELERHVFAVV